MEILFEKGIPGFKDYKKFVLGDVEGNPKFKTITSKDNSNVGFIAISPFEIQKDYEIEIKDDTLEELKIEKPEDVMVFTLITLGRTIEKSTVNLKAPIIVNIKNNKGKQLIFQDDKYQIKAPLIGSGE